jgi:DNA replication ATP-dependent helicase Dna2
MDALNAPEIKLGRMITNEAEATAVLQSVRAFTEAGVHPTKIGVLALYRSQIKLLDSVLSSCKGVEVLTADQSQGRDKSVILISLVRSNDALATGDLLKDWRRLNVCFTRAKTKLVMFGSRRTLAEPLKDLFAMVDARSWGLELGQNALEQHSVRKRLLSSPVKGRQAKRSQLGVVSANSPRRPVRP